MKNKRPLNHSEAVDLLRRFVSTDPEVKAYVDDYDAYLVAFAESEKQLAATSDAMFEQYRKDR